ncbi:hypothetical protein CBL_10171 [Carabus blaptoides fortunei]
MSFDRCVLSHFTRLLSAGNSNNPYTANFITKHLSRITLQYVSSRISDHVEDVCLGGLLKSVRYLPFKLQNG